MSVDCARGKPGAGAAGMRQRMAVDWTMARVTKIYLVAGVLSLVLGLAVSVDLIDSKAYPMLTVALPAGAICLGLFFICYIFEKESVRFDEERAARSKCGESARRNETARESGDCGRAAVAKH